MLPLWRHNTTNCRHGSSFSATYSGNDQAFTPSSNHGGGVNILKADGSVEFISNNVDQQIWWALGSKDDESI